MGITTDFKEKLTPINDTIGSKLYDLGYGNLRTEISNDETCAQSLNIIYDIPGEHSTGEHSNSIKIKYDANKDAYEFVDPKTNELISTKDVGVVNKMLTDYIDEIPNIRIKHMYDEIEHWHDVDGLECSELFNKIYDILKLEDEDEGAILTTEECTQALHYVVGYCKRREANA